MKGEIFRNADLATTMERLAAHGRAGFYEGPVAQTIEAYLREHGGHLTAQDLADNTVEWVDPVSVNYRGFDIWELPPNTQGVAALQMLNILEGFDLKSMGFA